VFRALIVLFSYGYNIETCKIIEATFLTLHFCPMRIFFAGQRGHGPSGPVVNTLVPSSYRAYPIPITAWKLERVHIN